MRVIHKYGLERTEEIQTLYLPAGYHIVHIGEQDESIVIWVDHNTDNTNQIVKVQIVGTGQEVGDYALHLKTIQMVNGLVWHIYQR